MANGSADLSSLKSSYQKGKVTRKDKTFEELAVAEGNASYNYKLAKLIASRVYDNLGAQRGEEVLKIFQQSVKIQNPEIFLESVRSNLDIGTEAYKMFPEDI